jgi:hypothetical protein
MHVAELFERLEDAEDLVLGKPKTARKFTYADRPMRRRERILHGQRFAEGQNRVRHGSALKNSRD